MAQGPRVGVIFPGQGSQSVGMGGSVAQAYPAARALFDRASAVLGYDLYALTQSGPEEKLRETLYSQPAIFVVNCAIRAAAGEVLSPVVSCGHSFGEFCSLTIAGALTFEEGVRLVDARAKAMQHAAELAPGGMSAVLGLADDQVREAAERAARETGLAVQLANWNAPAQIVISGHVDAVRLAGEYAGENGAKRVVPLNVSGAWHSRLMEPAVQPFAQAVARAAVAMPEFPVISNVDAQPYASVEKIRTNLVRSVTDEVLWHATAQRMLEERLDIVVEFGANPVLSPLLKRLGGVDNVRHVGDAEGVAKLLAALPAVSRA